MRSWDPATCTLTIDFVAHSTGAAGRRATTARPGDLLVIEAPPAATGPTRTPTGTCWWATRASLPTIAASLEALHEGALAIVRFVCDGPDHEMPLTSPGDLDVVWLAS